MSGFLTFMGHWHPVVVHLPIGMILGALLLQALGTRPGFVALRPAVPVVLLAGALSGLISCCTGYVLSLSGDYDASLVGWHQWMGIGLIFLCFYVWARLRQRGVDWVQWILSAGLLGLVIVTGHLGGSLTHGSDYLSFGGGGSNVAEVDSPIVNVQEILAYQRVVRPLLRDNCYSCHGANRQKGGLRLDDSAGIFRGGKDGVVIRRGFGGESELIKRLLLPEEDEHHMPPKEKRPLNSREILLLHWWIDQGAELSRKVAELKQPDSVRGALLAVQGSGVRGLADGAGGFSPGGAGSRAVAAGDVPADEVEVADEKVIAELRRKGVLVMPVAQGRNWLSAEVPEGGAAGNGVAVASGPAGGVRGMDSVVRLLLGLKKQLISLKIGDTSIGASAMAAIGQCVALRSLDLVGTPVGDAGLAAVKGLIELRVLNLVGTRVSAAGIEGLKGLGKLRVIYLYKTKVAAGDWAELKRIFPKVELDTGGYSMPVLETDTAVVRQVKKP